VQQEDGIDVLLLTNVTIARGILVLALSVHHTIPEISCVCESRSSLQHTTAVAFTTLHQDIEAIV